jgi:hypothetical protein
VDVELRTSAYDEEEEVDSGRKAEDRHQAYMEVVGRKDRHQEAAEDTGLDKGHRRDHPCDERALEANHREVETVMQTPSSSSAADLPRQLAYFHQEASMAAYDNMGVRLDDDNADATWNTWVEASSSMSFLHLHS